MSAASDRISPLLFGRRPLSLWERRAVALMAVLAPVIVVVQLVLGAWLLAAFWMLLTVLFVVNLVGDVRRARAAGRLSW